MSLKFWKPGAVEPGSTLDEPDWLVEHGIGYQEKRRTAATHELIKCLVQSIKIADTIIQTSSEQISLG